MRELERLQNGLSKSKTLLYKPDQEGLACSFVNGGLVIDSFTIEDGVLADALAKKGVNGVVEGSNFEMLKNNYEWFSLHVKSKKLYQELESSL
ncbi:hypothetical protein CLV24_11834 [Pontibacter ummariensis]|uniref:Uncharacterized protein n=1 Tax=Pontibacter ummariensis TaxID=1610492 RepID=A0A239IRA5_9BACT|nr:hypothetical protein [Pontibacter ummariensis]PRY09697.1 hypothetical protein CLV24_11834 [Pontibacter ummariensis]SNS95758.1 hypothetical protein SAMN06296052_11854 [Pontibacter ummariensis]